jgi:hypothetical protein
MNSGSLSANLYISKRNKSSDNAGFVMIFKNQAFEECSICLLSKCSPLRGVQIERKVELESVYRFGLEFSEAC